VGAAGEWEGEESIRTGEKRNRVGGRAKQQQGRVMQGSVCVDQPNGNIMW
jgi:hypothetical protein